MMEKQNTVEQKAAAGDTTAIDDIIGQGAAAFEHQQGIDCFPGVDYPPGSKPPEPATPKKQD